MEFYKSLVSCTEHDLRAEYDRWTTKWAQTKTDDLPTNPASALAGCDETFYPKIHQYLKIFCCIPATTATPERTFSTLKYLKSYLRSTTTDARLNGLTQMYLHRDIDIDIEKVINRFAAGKRRVNFTL